MPRPIHVYTMADGSKMTVPQMHQHPANTWPVSAQCIYERIRKPHEERTLENLLRPPVHRRYTPQSTKAPKVSPWRLGPAVRTRNSLETFEEIREGQRPPVSLSGARLGSLTVLRHGPVLNGVPTWVCQCDCGDKVTYRADTMRQFGVEDCGCGISERRATA